MFLQSKIYLVSLLSYILCVSFRVIKCHRAINLICASLEINIFGVPDTMSYTSQCMPDIKEIATNLYWTMTVTGCLFQGLKGMYEINIQHIGF